MDPARTLDLPCPNCGSPLTDFDPEDACIGTRCLRCGYIGAVSTNTNGPGFDPTPYTVWVEWDGIDRRRVIASVGNALCVGVKAARGLIDNRLPVKCGVQALDVQGLYRLFRRMGLNIRVEPAFPWRLEETPGQPKGESIP